MAKGITTMTRGKAILVTGLFLSLGSAALANGEVQDTTYSVEATIRWIIAGLGGVIALAGVGLAGLSVRDLATIELSAQRQKLTIKKINQGVVIVLAGVAVLIAGLMFLPDKSHSMVIKGKAIQFGDDKADCLKGHDKTTCRWRGWVLH